jgi:hypothetical protein
VTFVDYAEAVTFGVCEHDEIRRLGIEIPVNALRSEGHQPVDFGGLLGSIPNIEVKVNARVLLRRRFACAKT